MRRRLNTYRYSLERDTTEVSMGSRQLMAEMLAKVVSSRNPEMEYVEGDIQALFGKKHNRSLDGVAAVSETD